MSTAQHKLPGHERRAAIVDAAIKLFSEKGFRGTTTRELAAAMGVSEPVLYQHFATKSELYTAIIEACSYDTEKAKAGFDAFLDRDDDRAFLTYLAEGILDWHDTNRAYARLLLFSALEGHELAQLFYERQSCGAIDAITRYMERRIARGRFRTMDAALMGRAFVGMVGGYARDCMVIDQMALPLDRKTIVEGMVNIFLEGIQLK